MIKTTLLLLTVFLFSGCFNKHGISTQYYSDCDEYYDLQGYYHKECGKDDMVTYKQIGDGAGAVVDWVIGDDEEPQGNVW